MKDEKYYAVMKLSGSERCQERIFLNRENAEAYVRDMSCRSCKNDTDAGFYVLEDGTTEPVKNVLHTDCGAAYDIEEIDQEEYKRRVVTALAELHSLIQQTPWEDATEADKSE